MMRSARFLAIFLLLFAIVSCGKGTTGGEPTGTAEAPVFAPPAGNYDGTQNVQIWCATEDASIHYTTDGSVPNGSSPVYNSPITVNSSKILKAISLKAGLADSSVTIASYTINGGGTGTTKVATPSFTPESGTYNSFQEVSIQTQTSGATIHYTTDGTAPTSSSAEYTAPITVSEDMTLKAFAIKSGLDDSNIASATYYIDIALPQVATPIFTPSPGYYNEGQAVSIECATPGVVIHYTVNGTTPTSSSDVYTNPIDVNFNMTLKAIAVKDGWADSAIAGGTYIIDWPIPVAADPVIDHESGTYADDQMVSMTTATEGATIHYTMNGSIPSAGSPVYVSPLVVNSNTTIKAFTRKFGWADSNIVEVNLTIEDPLVKGEIWTDPVTGMEFVWVPAGSFIMGYEWAADETVDEVMPHPVTLTKGFWIGRYEVTQAQWEAVTGSNPSYHNSFEDSASRPVEQFDWSDLQSYIEELNIGTGQTYRLPTEAEWEYCAKATKSPGTKFSGTSDWLVLDKFAWSINNSFDNAIMDYAVRPVGQKLPNELGLYDMSGNVWERVSDWYSSTYYSTSPSTDPTGPSTGTKHTIRGGGAYDTGGWLMTSTRLPAEQDFLYIDVGFRLVLDPSNGTATGSP